MNYVELLLPAALLLAVISLVRLWRRSNERPWMLTVAIAVLVLISSDLVASFLSMLLERQYDGKHFNDTALAIVVLSGGVEKPDAGHPFAVLGHDTYARCLHAAWLYRSRPRPILLTGRNCAAPMARFLQSEGVLPEDLWQENDATTTHENAVYSARILHAKGIGRVALVTDAKSMLRAELCFRKQNVDIVPVPVGLGVFELTVLEFVPNWKAIRANGDAMHEIAGLMWYRWKGWI